MMTTPASKPTNEQIAARFELMAQFMELLGEDGFRVNAYARAARAIADFQGDIASLAGNEKQLMEVPGVGGKTAKKIQEFVNTGKIAELEDLRAKVPAGLLDVLSLQGIGPKTVRIFWQDAGVVDMPSLQKIIDDGSILKLPRMGAKSVEKLKHAIAFGQTTNQRHNIGLILPVAERIVAAMLAVKGVKQAAFAGSLRRGRDTVGDLDILIETKDPKGAGEAFRALPGVTHVLAAGDTKSSVHMAVQGGSRRWGEAAEGWPTIQVDLKAVPEGRWGAGLMYFTGSKEHNVLLRERALARGLTLNEYGLFPEDKSTTEPPQARGIKPVAAASEEEIYKALGLAWIPPEQREGRNEITRAEGGAKAKSDAFADLLAISDVKAELHAHTTASDGVLSIVELASEAKRRGFHTIAVTDHSRSSAQANGLSVERLLEHIDAVHAARAKLKGITILAGSEVDILADGTLDYEDAVLAKLDVVVASPHAALTQESDVATARLLKAVKNPRVNILGHPTGRLINRRRGLEPDMSKILAAACEHNVALEINAHWMRLDLRDTHVGQAMAAGCLIAIDCDVHETEDYGNLRYGVLTARRGGVTKDRCINAWPADKLHAWLAAKHK